LDDSGIFNYEKYKGTSPTYYEPNMGDDSFTHNGHYFQFSKDCQENKYQERIEYFLIIRCMGRSTKPVKDLIDHVKEWSAHKPNKTTEIMRAEIKHGGYWHVQSNRPSRPISTVTLDEAQKNKVVADINEYLHPATARWYAARGIPHRRGYLFHGPPGTGKTSLSFAVAGIFGLSVYCASLSERDMSESDLASLFGQLPNRCIVLLEDIDSAGIRRDKSSVIPEQEHDSAVNESDKSSAPAPTEKVTEEKEDNNDNKSENKSEEKQHDSVEMEKKKSIRRRITHSLHPRKSSSKPNSETTTLATTASSPASAPPSVLTPAPSIKEVATSTKPTSTPTPPPPPPPPIDEEGSKSKISLAGLLNIIDGAASSEGRVLIMTTNYPEKLDSALIRPGRVDLQIKFTLATRTQVEEIFRRMYSDEADGKKCDGSDGGEKKYAPEKKGSSSNDKRKEEARWGATGNKSPNFATLPPDQLTEMARQFADALPEAVFSPAEIQGYLLQKKSDPQGALDGVGEWRDAVLEAKKKGKKVIELK
jgi:chaperone BCS1